MKILSSVFNYLLKQDPEVAADLFAQAGKIIEIKFTPLPLKIFILIEEHKIQLIRQIKISPHVTITGTPIDFMAVLVSKNPDAQKKLFISGDIQLAHILQMTLQKLDVDWEEILSKYAGDAFAYSFFEGIRQLKKSKNKINNYFLVQTKEYLTEEISLLVSRQEIEDFYKDVDEIRGAVERLSARIEILTS